MVAASLSFLFALLLCSFAESRPLQKGKGIKEDKGSKGSKQTKSSKKKKSKGKGSKSKGSPAPTIPPNSQLTPAPVARRGSKGKGSPAPTIPPISQLTPAPVARRLNLDGSNTTNLFESETNEIFAKRKQYTYDDVCKILDYRNFETRLKKGKAVLSDLMLDPTFDKTSASDSHLFEPSHSSQARSIVAFSAPTSLNYTKGKNAAYFKNFHYFLDHGINCTVHSTVIITTNVVADVYRERIATMNSELCRDSPFSIRILVREDKCYDMESMATFLRETDTSQFDYFLYINCGMIGPKWEGNRHWTELFTSRLSETVKLTGITINMSFHPHVQSFTVAFDRIGIEIIKNSNAVYDCGVYNDQSMTEEERWKIIDRYEIGMSRQIIDAGYEINSRVGPFGDSFTIKKSDFPKIIQRSQEASPFKPVVNASERDIWDSNTECFLLPYGDDIWSENGLRSVGNGKLPPWSDFVFFKASREILLPEIEEELHYNNPSHILLKDFQDASLPVFEEESVCEHAKSNFREASKLSVIVTGFHNSGTNMLAQLIRSAPGLFGGFEGGLLLDKDFLIHNRKNPHYDWLIWDQRNDLWGLDYESRDLVVEGARCDAEMYARLHRYSPLFHNHQNNNSMIVDKTPGYLVRGLVEVMDRAPGVPVIVTKRSIKKRGVSDEEMKKKIDPNAKNLEDALKKYPDRIYVVDTISWAEEPNKVMKGVYDFLGLQWRPEYLSMEALNAKRIPGSVVSKPFDLSKQLESDKANWYSSASKCLSYYSLSIRLWPLLGLWTPFFF